MAKARHVTCWQSLWQILSTKVGYTANEKKSDYRKIDSQKRLFNKKNKHPVSIAKYMEMLMSNLKILLSMKERIPKKDIFSDLLLPIPS